MDRETLIQAHLFIGEEDDLYQTVTQKLQAVFCKRQPAATSCFCSECQKIKNGQHSSILFIAPENQYVLSNLDPIFERIRFSLGDNEHVFFIMKKAHLLSPVCANKLLKTLEEPPAGYIFYLLANNEHSVLPTIRSRCHIHHLKTPVADTYLHPFLNFFVDPEKQPDPFLFDQELKKYNPSEQETITFLHDLIAVIKKKISQYNSSCATYADIERLQKTSHYKLLSTNLEFLERQFKKPPQAGGSILFWRKLFLELNSIEHHKNI